MSDKPIPTISDNPTASDLTDLYHEERKWVVASEGRWESAHTLSEAVRNLGMKPDAGIMYVSTDFTVDPVFGGVSATSCKQIELSSEEMEKLMLICAHEKLEEMMDDLCFIEEHVDCYRLNDVLSGMLRRIEEKVRN